MQLRHQKTAVSKALIIDERGTSVYSIKAKENQKTTRQVYNYGGNKHNTTSVEIGIVRYESVLHLQEKLKSLNQQKLNNEERDGIRFGSYS